MPRKRHASSPASGGDAWRRLKQDRAAVVALCVLVLLILCGIFASYIAPYPYDLQDATATFQLPNAQHLLGTDNFGRDILSRIIYGRRVSLIVGFSSIIVAIIVGGLLGAISGYYGGKVDNILMRLMDILMAIPGMLLAISLAAVLKPGLMNLVIAIAIAEVPGYARVVRASVLTIKDQEYIEAATCIGASDRRIILRHIIPNCMAPIIVQATLGVAGAMPVRGVPELSRPRHPAAHAGVGLHALLGPSVHPSVLAYDDLPGPCHHDHIFRPERPRRRPARCIGSAYEELR